MKKRGLQRLLALILSLIMISSTLTEVLPAALAAGNSGTSSYADEDGVPPTNDFTDTDKTGRPNLYVDFLGDNDQYTLWTKGYNPDGSPAYYPSAPGTLMAPAGYDQSASTNPVEGNRWKGYTADPRSTAEGKEVIFWVGVGLDRNDLQKLWSEGGAYSLELGFYYNQRFIEPYVANGDFKATLTNANLDVMADYPDNTQWSGNYEILRAEYDLDPQTDEITQETMAGMDEIMKGGNGQNWKMLYISLENTTPGSDARFEDAYRDAAAGEFLEGTYEEEEPKPKTEYIMLIPFVYKEYDTRRLVCLRLARNATHFSIGAGESGDGTSTTTTGTEPYAAWERVTTRNPGKNIKILTNFTGDLNIFREQKEPEDLYNATLQIIDAGSTLNKAKLWVTDDPSPDPAYVNTNGSVLTNLDDGTGLSVDIECNTGYEFTVKVTYKDGTGQDVTLLYESVTGQSNYTARFVMPAVDVTVTVQFSPANVTEFLLYLAEVTDPIPADEIAGNYAKVTRYYTDDAGAPAQATMDSNTAATLTHPDNVHDDGPSMIAKERELIQVDVTTHADYEAVVYVKQFSTDTGLTNLTVTAEDYEVEYESYTCSTCHRVYDRDDTTVVKVDSDTGQVTLDCPTCNTSALPGGHTYHQIILPHGGAIRFNMVPRDLDIVVTYRKAVTATAKLEVWHETDADGNIDNAYEFENDVAQLVYPEYDVDNHASSAYSGVVRQDDNGTRPNANDDTHSVLANDQDILPWIHRTDATLSGALGGDDPLFDLPCKLWRPISGNETSAESQNSIMALLAAATSPTAFKNALLPRDLEQARDRDMNEIHIYKNFQQEHYAQSELGVFADYLWEMATRIENDSTSTLSGYLVSVPDPAVTGGTLYEYFDLTAAQVQAYLVQCWNAELGDEENLKAYNGAKGYYDVAQAFYEEAVGNLISLTAPVAPVAAPGWSVDAMGVRSYADRTAYANYIARYRAYIEDYQDYVEAVLAAGYDSFSGYENYPAGDGTSAPAPNYAAVEGSIMQTVDIKPVADAAAMVSETSGIWTPGESGPDAFITTRSGREVWVVLEAYSGWTVESVSVYRDANGSLGALMTDVTVTQSSDYINVYTFEMPEDNCIVKVNYARRATNKLIFEVYEADGQPDNISELTAYGPQENTQPLRYNVTSDHNDEPFQWPATGADPVYVYADGMIALKVEEAVGYQAVVEAQARTMTATGQELWPGYKEYLTVADGEVLTIPMPDNPTDVVKIVVTYVSSATIYNAYIDVINHDGGRSGGVWQSNQRNQELAYEGDGLTGEVTVAPGYYIHSVTAVGETTGTVYPYVLSGNGYANGLNSNSIMVTVDVTMPAEDLQVTVNVRKGPPPEEGDFPLNLAVVDPDNDETPYADNWAELEVVPDNDTTPIGPAGLGTTGGGATTAAGRANAGDEVRIHFDAADGYYVHSVTAAPANLSIPLEWVNEDGEQYVKFIMPAGSVGVTVEFKEGQAPAYNLFLAKTEDYDPGDVADNRATEVRSPSLAGGKYDIGDSHLLPVVPAAPLEVPDPTDPAVTTSGVAKAGEQVTVDLTVAEGWYVHSVTVTDSAGNALPSELFTYDSAGTLTAATYITNTSADDDGAVEFTMPNSHANVVVHYRQGPLPVEPEYAMMLTVADPDNNPTQNADNWARAALTGSGASATDTLGIRYAAMTDLAYAKAGDLVTIEYGVDAVNGFALDIIVVTPSGLMIVPVYLGGGKAQFTMPAENVQVLVKFKQGKATQYTANLVLRGPGDSVTDWDVRGTFGTLTGNYPTDAVFSQTAAAGDVLDIDLFASDGYYIRDITVTPAYLGATATLTGSFGSQQAQTVMPAGNITINVYFEKGWPDEKNYPITLKVLDPAYVDEATDNSYAQLTAPLTTGAVYGGGVETVWSAADNDRVKVKIVPKTGYTYDSTTVTVVDRGGNPVDWSYAMVDGAAGITFAMPPNGVTVTVRFRPVTTADKTYNITLVTRGDGTAEVTASGHTPITDNGDVIPGVGALTTVTVKAEPDTDRYVKAAYAVTAGGEQLIVPMTQVTAGGTVTFAMPEDNVTVHVVFSDDDDPVPVNNDLPATLIVSGPDGSGSATMGKTGETPISVNAGGADMLFAKEEDGLTVTIRPTPGYLIKSLTVIDSESNPVDYTWNSGRYDDSDDWDPLEGYQFTLNMPAGGLTVHVVLEKIEDKDKEYTAQVVVNDEEYASATTDSLNNAWLRDLVDEMTQTKLLSAKAGEVVELDVIVHPGYKVEYVVVTPRSHGIVPTLTKGAASDQTTSFIMPADDVVVYVKFVEEGLTRYSAYLVVEGPPGRSGNNATIHSNFSRIRGPIESGDEPERVQAAPVTEWVTVEYVWDDKSSVESVTVIDDAGNPVPFTQVNPHKINLPMVDRNIVITVTYRDDPEPVGYTVELHSIALDTGSASADNVAKITYKFGDDTALWRTAVAYAEHPYHTVQPEAERTIKVPAGETVNLDIEAGVTGVYIKAAYVLYEEGGQMIRCNLAWDDENDCFVNPQGTSFAVHPGHNDVYVYYTTEKPTEREYAAVLMLDGPTSSSGTAAIYAGTADSYTEHDSVTANGGHGHITPAPEGTVTVEVTPAAGYVIDTVLVTPLGITGNDGLPLTVPLTLSGGVYSGTFEMPWENVAVYVKLKESVTKEYTATLHYIQEGSQVDVGSQADLYYTPSGASAPTKISANLGAPVNSMVVSQDSTVSLSAVVNPVDPSTGKESYILAAYVLKGTTLVPQAPELVALAPALEGTRSGTVPSNDYDGTATFTMPADHVDVYLVVGDTKPADNWSTAILLVTDDDDNGGVNIGQNSSELADDGMFDGVTSAVQTVEAETGTPGAPAMGHKRMYVTVGQKMTLTVHDPEPDYQFKYPAIVTHSVRGMPGLSEINPYHYEYTVGAYNSAVHVHYESALDPVNRLTVEILDPDNPGDGSVTNTVTTEPAGLTPLTLNSVNHAGAYQIIQSVTANAQVSLTVTPAAGYKAVAEYTYNTTTTNTTTTEVTLVSGAGNSYTGNFPMPNHPAKVTVKFYRAYNATLTVRDVGLQAAADETTGMVDQNSRFTMTEDDRGRSVTTYIDNDMLVSETVSLPDLPHGTGLTVTPDDAVNSNNIVGVIATTSSGSVYLADNDGDRDYCYSIDRSDTDIIVLLSDESDSAGDLYMATVQTVGLPAGTTAASVVSIEATGRANGNIWTVAAQHDTVTTKITVPSGYKAVVSAADTAGNPVTLTGTTTLTAYGEVTFTMPAADVVVTVKYVKDEFKLTLEVVDATTKSNTTALTVGGTPWTVSTGSSTQSQTVAAETVINLLSARPLDSTVRVVAVMKTTSAGTTYLSGVLNGGVSYNSAGLVMPEDDMTLTVIYGNVPGTGVDAPKEPYIAATQKVGDGGLLHNAITSIVDTTTGGMPNNSPHWTQAYEGDGVSVSFTTALGWYATVTAVKQSNNESVTVIQQGNTGTGTAYIAMPAADVLITVTYSQTPPTGAADLKLTLIKPDGKSNNRGEIYDLTADTTLTALTVRGSDDPTSSAVSTDATVTVNTGNRLVVSGNWETKYRIEKITVTVGDVEMELPRNSYGQNATALFYMPGRNAEVKIYFASIYTATLHIEGNTTGDSTSMTDNRAGTVPVITDGGQLTELNGGETIMTTASPGTGNRLVGVVRVTATTGAATVSRNGTNANQYDFTMPTEDVDVYVVYEPEPTGDEVESYIAKVAIHPDSEGYGVGDNRVTITNASDPAAASGPFWTAAKGGDPSDPSDPGDTIDVTVYLDTGYQALITSVKKDPGGDDIYINRLIFVDSGTTGTFTMPVESDATVTIKYMKGYNLSLEVSDNSDSGDTKHNEAQVLENADRRYIDADSKGTTASVDYDSSADINPNDTINVINGVDSGTDVDATSEPDTGVKTRIFYSTYFDGTVNLMPPATTSPVRFDMLAEDVLVSVLFQDENDPYDLIAKVALAGESDIVGNGYVSDGDEGVVLSPKISNINHPAPTTTTGQIWSTTQVDHRMKVTFTVAKGYMVEIQVRRDSNNTYIMSDEGNFSTKNGSVAAGVDTVVVNHTGNDVIDDSHYFEFDMDSGDVTVILTYVKAASIPKPYDPEHQASTPYKPLEKGWIYGENRGDYAVITVPTLNKDKLYNADEYVPGDASTRVTFRFFIDLTTPGDLSDATELEEGTDIILEPYDVNDLHDPGDLYNYDEYYPGYTGAKFNLRLAEATPTSDAAKALAEILDNEGTNDKYPELFIMAQNAKGEISEYTQVVITPAYGLAIRFYSYAPTHAATVSLHLLMDGADPMESDNYESEPLIQTEVVGESGAGLYRQTALVRTANLLGDPADGSVDPMADDYEPLTYMLVIEKPSHITYTRVNITLNATYQDGTYAYNKDTNIFTVRDDVILLAGDVDGSGSVKMQDRYLINKWYTGRYEWTTTTDETDLANWKISIYNPKSQAYWCDLDGDGRVTYQDYIIVNYTKHFGANAEWYKWTDTAPDPDVERAIPPWGLEQSTTLPPATMSLEEEDGVYDLEEDTGIYDLEDDTGIYDVEDGNGDSDGVYDLRDDTTLYPVADGGTADGTKEPAALPPSDEETDALLPEEKKDEEETADPPEDATQ